MIIFEHHLQREPAQAILKYFATFLRILIILSKQIVM